MRKSRVSFRSKNGKKVSFMAKKKRASPKNVTELKGRMRRGGITSPKMIKHAVDVWEGKKKIPKRRRSRS